MTAGAAASLVEFDDGRRRAAGVAVGPVVSCGCLEQGSPVVTGQPDQQDHEGRGVITRQVQGLHGLRRGAELPDPVLGRAWSVAPAVTRDVAVLIDVVQQPRPLLLLT